MYAMLKQMMAAKGFTVSNGDGWSAADAAQFRDFAVFVMGMPHDEAYRVTTHPEDFRDQLTALAQQILGTQDSVADMIEAANVAEAMVQEEVAASTAEETQAAVEESVQEEASEPVVDTDADVAADVGGDEAEDPVDAVDAVEEGSDAEAAVEDTATGEESAEQSDTFDATPEE